MKFKSLFARTATLLFAFGLAACNKEPQQITFEGKTMGTTYHIKYIDNGTKTLPKPELIKAQLDHLLDVVNQEMSTYKKDSQISQFNQMKEVDTPFVISADFAKVVAEAVRLNQVTEGALDVTVGPLVNLWGFGPDKRLNKVPTQAQIDERSQSVGIEKFVLDTAQNTLTKKVPNLYLDLSSIAKGFGVDKLAEHLESLGIEHYLVEIGGEIRGKGQNLLGKAWNIAIEKPEFAQGSSSQITLPLNNLAMATSGNYRNYFEDEQGKRLSHIIDGKTHRPIEHNLASITVLHPSTMTADGLSTGLFVLGAEKALAVAEREQLAVFLILKTANGYETQMSSKFAALLEQR